MAYSFQKEIILEFLTGTENHYSVDGIHKELTKEIPKISLMTVYRNLKKLVKEGVVFPFHIENTLHFCGNKQTHSHLHCVNCGEIVDNINTAINDIIQIHVKSENFTPLSNGIVVRGFCKNCKQRKQKNQTNVVQSI